MGPAATALQLWQDAVLGRLHWRLVWRLVRPFCGLMHCLIILADRLCKEESRDADASVYVTVSRRI
jgi:hypothetical protein